MESRIISIEEANRMLPLLHQIMRDITTHWEKIIQRRTQLECLEKDLRQGRPGAAAGEMQNRLQSLKLELNHLIDKINSYIREVEELGCFVEEFKRGIVNFPSLYNGRKVFLCWRPEEGCVSHWHELDETYSDRVPIRDHKEFLAPRPQVR